MSWLTKTTSGAAQIWRIRSTGALAAAALLVTLGVGCSPSPDPGARRPNVILVTLDTLRADRLGSYGYPRDTSPFLDTLAAEGLRFTRAYSVSSWTVPSMASMLTGVHPESHGVTHGLVQQGEIFGQEVLSGEHLLLAEILQEAGYRTFAVTASLHLESGFGFGQGFDRYENVGFANSGKVLPVLRELQGEILEGEGPYFLWLHLFDPHDPYQPRRPWIRSYYPEPGVAQKFGKLSPLALRRHQQAAVDSQIDGFVEFAQAAYDSEINYTDRAVQKAFETLAVSPDEMIVITSDHGEEFLEHQDFGHAGTLFEEQVRIPLIVRLPDRAHAGMVVQEPVSILDILPSILDWLEIDPPVGTDGTSFFTGLEEPTRPTRPVFFSLSRPQTELSSIVVGDWKYIHDHGDDADHQLFDLNRDPEELSNLFGQEAAREDELARQLANHLAAAESRRLETSVEEVPPETVEQMRALGYVD